MEFIIFLKHVTFDKYQTPNEEKLTIEPGTIKRYIRRELDEQEQIYYVFEHGDQTYKVREDQVKKLTQTEVYLYERILVLENKVNKYEEMYNRLKVRVEKLYNTLGGLN